MLLAVVLVSSSSGGAVAGFVARTGLSSTSARAAASAKQLSMSFFDTVANSFSRTFSTTADGKSKFYTVGITGASGLLGTALIDELGKQGSVNGKPVRVVKLQRSSSIDAPDLGSDEPIVTAKWNPRASDPQAVLDHQMLSSMDAIVHLAGENVATGLGPLGFLGIRPWTSEKKTEILASRVGPTEALSKAIAASNTPTTLLSASGVGVYGDNFVGESAPIVDETMDTSSHESFLAQVSREWEAATQIAAAKQRVVNLRMGVVMSTQGGALAKLYPIFFMGGGGNVGSGQQYFTYISARDAARAMVHTVSTPSLRGPVNICAPNACTNAVFTAALGRVLNRPTIIPFPAFAVDLMFGEMGNEMLLGGVRAAPGKLEKSGFQFLHPTIGEALQSAMDEDI